MFSSCWVCAASAAPIIAIANTLYRITSNDPADV
jgi:hypothetical protein